MGKEQSLNYKDLPEEKLRVLLKDAEATKDYALQVLICRALLPYEERQCLALTEIKNLEALARKSQANVEEVKN